ncbi:MAG: hypothetical protein JWO20_711, partial [Candidatus Angelobacter sp.]|nr:hypothetical protein [Candidatus Angelobacter sp.]
YAAKSKGRNAVLKYRDVAAQKRAKEAS